MATVIPRYQIRNEKEILSRWKIKIPSCRYAIDITMLAYDLKNYFLLLKNCILKLINSEHYGK